jgi:hypothetical protein
MGEKRGIYRFLEGKPVGKRQLGNPRHGWEDNIKLNHQGMGLEAWLRIGIYCGLL